MAAEVFANDRRSPASTLDDPMLRREWMAIAWSSEVGRDRHIARRLLGIDVVLWRSSQGLHCWKDLCVHRGAKLSLGSIQTQPASTVSRNGQPVRECLVCPYHAWTYAPSGECIRMPAHPALQPPQKAHAEVYTLEERYGVIWVCLEAQGHSLPEFLIAEESGFRSVLAGPYRFRAQGPRVIENLLDVAHLGYVHAGLLGAPDRLEIEDYEVVPGNGERGPEAKEIRIWQPDPDGTGSAALVTYRYWVHSPLTAGFVKVHGDHRFGILAQVTPVDEEVCESRLIITLNYGESHSDADLLRFQDLVTEQDRGIVESQRPELLPLDLQAELHLRSDRMAIAYRKWLAALGFRYGTA